VAVQYDGYRILKLSVLIDKASQLNKPQHTTNQQTTNQRIEEHTKFIDEQTTNQHFWTIKNNEVAVYAREKKVRGSKKKCVASSEGSEGREFLGAVWETF